LAASFQKKPRPDAGLRLGTWDSAIPREDISSLPPRFVLNAKRTMRKPGELDPVFQAMLANAVRICGAAFGTLIGRSGAVLLNDGAGPFDGSKIAFDPSKTLQ
jgi:hypothetical protein